MHGIALLLGLLAAGCLYVAAPNQVLLAPASRARAGGFCVIALALAVMAIMLWDDALGRTGSTVAVVLVVTGGLSLWPMLGAWMQNRRIGVGARS